MGFLTKTEAPTHTIPPSDSSILSKLPFKCFYKLMALMIAALDLGDDSVHLPVFPDFSVVICPEMSIL